MGRTSSCIFSSLLGYVDASGHTRLRCCHESLVAVVARTTVASSICIIRGAAIAEARPWQRMPAACAANAVALDVWCR